MLRSYEQAATEISDRRPSKLLNPKIIPVAADIVRNRLGSTAF